jgi:hypothetical protein
MVSSPLYDDSSENAQDSPDPLAVNAVEDVVLSSPLLLLLCLAFGLGMPLVFHLD